MKIFLLIAALCALSLAQDNSAIRIDLGSIVQTTVNDPKACRSDETCYPLVGFGGEGLNRRRGQPIFNWPRRAGTGAVEATTLGTGAAKIVANVPTAVTPDNAALWTWNFRIGARHNGNAVRLENVPTLVQAQGTEATSGITSILPHIAALKRNIATSSFSNADGAVFNGARGSGTATGSSFQYGTWLSATANGVVRCSASVPFATIDLWFENLVPQGLYSLHEVEYRPTGAITTSGTFSYSSNYATTPLSGAGGSYFVANADGRAYVNRWLPGDALNVACPFQRADTNLNFMGYEARYHSSGIALGAAEELTRPLTTTNLFTAAGAADTYLLGYGLGSHSHVTISYPDVSRDPAIAVSRVPKFGISNQFIV